MSLCGRLPDCSGAEGGGGAGGDVGVVLGVQLIIDSILQRDKKTYLRHFRASQLHHLRQVSLLLHLWEKKYKYNHGLRLRTHLHDVFDQGCPAGQLVGLLAHTLLPVQLLSSAEG